MNNRNAAIILPEVTGTVYQPVLPGMYGMFYDDNEVEHLNKNLFGDLIAEVCLMRVIMRRALEKAKGIEDLNESLNVLNALGLAAMRVARLLEVQIKLSEKSPRAMDALVKALSEFRERMEAE